MSLPTKEQFEELKKKRKQYLEKKRIMERQVCRAWAPSGYHLLATPPPFGMSCTLHGFRALLFSLFWPTLICGT
jgi:hypothetical protein